MMHPFLFAIAHQLEETNIDGVCSNGVSLLFTSSFKIFFYIYQYIFVPFTMRSK